MGYSGIYVTAMVKMAIVDLEWCYFFIAYYVLIRSDGKRRQAPPPSHRRRRGTERGRELEKQVTSDTNLLLLATIFAVFTRKLGFF